ncbi:glycosyltransferase family 25 protein [Canicola haemoglobinophilus]|uniref:glycosyltransferase family 25 protein n=1 Tax=Canicola haemoglobinophilus TaxID=733 RepID=UPI000E064BBF|nr:glycosyltransferase family 25 protein [Canicola haemoglobinophilus]STO53799.1 Lob1 protein [Canicola haemoglobinophilus]
MMINQQASKQASKQANIFIINLAKSTARKQFITEQFSRLNENLKNPIPYHFFAAINGKENPDFPLFKKYNKTKHFQRKGNQLSLSQLGCWASHYLLWEKCVELNEPIIILEDDAILKENFLEVYNFLSSPQNSFEFFWLSIPSPAKRKRNQKYKVICNIENTENSIAQFYYSWANTTGYFITPKAAQKLLTHCYEWVYEVDTQMERYWETKIPYLSIIPFCVEPDLSMESNISTTDNMKNKKV